jgi:signal transduction histidine kinase
MKKRLEKIRDSIGPVPRSQVALSFGIALLLAFVALSTDLYRVEAFFFDLRMRLKGDEALHPEVLLVPLGDKPLPAGAGIDSIATHRVALENLIAQKPRAIVYLNRFDPAEVEARPGEAEAFVAIAQAAEKQGVKIFLGSDVDLSGEVLPPYPLSLLPHYPAILHKDGTLFSEDKVMRRMLLTAFGRPAIHLRAAYPDLSDEELLARAPQVRGAYYYKPAEAWHVLIRFPRNTAATLNGFPRLSFTDAFEGRSLGAAKGKILLVETMRKEPMNDYGYTPYSRDTYTNPRLVVHGASLDTLLKDDGIILLSRNFDAGLTFLFALTLAFVGITMRPSRGIVALLILSGSLFLVSLVLFRFGYSLRLVHPLLAMFFTYYLIVPYRAIFEYKKRWEVQEKHDLLVQVEEMKGNFLSLMSHDLKTPVARIQGLTELVLRQGNLSESQAEELRQILESTESLDKFISKILNLTKVESNEIKLDKRSKDLNKILEQCVSKLAFQAKAKDIQVELGLEPLFPIRLDPALLHQVFTNIIDNAIKYSPAGSRVRVLSREVGDQVEVTVEDSGEGLDEKDMEQLFTKFFRGKSHPGDQTKGSGLGLYLSRYFIELHDGTVEAESRKGEGMKFVIKLPLESAQ